MHDTGEKTDGLLVTGFRLGKADFGVDARLVQEVVKVGEVTRVHHAHTCVLGIRNLRGRIVTVVDLATHLSLGSACLGPDARLLIMEDCGESYGFLVDTVSEAVTLQEDRIAAPPASLDPTLRNRLRGVWHEDTQLMSILDPAALFQWDEMTA